MGISYNPKIVTDGLVLCLDAGNRRSYPATGTLWTDLSGQGNNGSLINSPTFNTGNLGNLVITGTEYVTIPMTPLLRPANGLTQECWVSLTNNGSTRPTFMGLQYGNSFFNSYGLWCDSANRLNAVIRNGVSSDSYIDIPTTVTPNIYYNFTHTYDGVRQILYVNGFEIGRVSTSGIIQYDPLNTILTLCCNFDGPGYNSGPGLNMLGAMSNAKIYNRALTAEEVLQNFNALRGRYGI